MNSWASWLLVLFSAQFIGHSAGQALAKDIPQEEAAALTKIVEDAPSSGTTLARRSESPAYPLIHAKPLTIPPIKNPLKVLKNPVTGRDIWYYEVQIKPFQKSVYPTLGPTPLVGYDGMSPGPTFLIPRGTETIVRFINSATKANAVHLHGSYSRAAFDGWAEDITNPGEYKDYYYPNQQSARLLWYHDHAMHLTAENAYMGQAGAYMITDPAEASLGLPSGYGTYDIPLILTSKQYNADGTLLSPAGLTGDGIWGDVIEVNGTPWPFQNVEPRKYRLRFLNAAMTRSFALYFAKSTALSTKLPFQVIASDAGLLERSISTDTLFISMGERYEIVFDFSPYAGQSVDLRNLDDVGGVGTDDDFDNTSKVMRFEVGSGPVADPSTVPATLRSIPAATGAAIKHRFRFHRSNGQWLINGIGFADVANRVLANVPRGTVEAWELENRSGGWTHPVHVHLVDFRVVRRSGGRSLDSLPYESAGLKDVVWLARGETAVVEAHYAPWDGVYMFHCHNLIHEDTDMMAAFNVTSLANFGYNNPKFLDPMDPQWRAKPFQVSDLTARTGPFADVSITQMINSMATANPYGDIAAVNTALADYWANPPSRKAKRVLKFKA